MEGADGDVAMTDAANPAEAVAGVPAENIAVIDASDAVPVAESTAGKAVPKNKRITTSYLTKYERARVLGTRALQIRQLVSFVTIVIL